MHKAKTARQKRRKNLFANKLQCIDVAGYICNDRCTLFLASTPSLLYYCNKKSTAEINPVWCRNLGTTFVKNKIPRSSWYVFNNSQNTKYYIRLFAFSQLLYPSACCCCGDCVYHFSVETRGNTNIANNFRPPRLATRASFLPVKFFCLIIK